MGTRVSSTYKTDHHDKTKILLKLALSPINQTQIIDPIKAMTNLPMEIQKFPCMYIVNIKFYLNFDHKIHVQCMPSFNLNLYIM